MNLMYCPHEANCQIKYLMPVKFIYRKETLSPLAIIVFYPLGLKPPELFENRLVVHPPGVIHRQC